MIQLSVLLRYKQEIVNSVVQQVNSKRLFEENKRSKYI